MAIFRNKAEDARELGFGSRNYGRSVRFINDDGTVNVRRTGLGGINNLDIYHYLTTMRRGKLSLLIATWYICINLLFGAIYYLVGPENFDGVDRTSHFHEFLSLFFFSAQTITTLGYGHLHPVSIGASVAAAVESLLGLLAFAIATGIIFGRFSRPRAHLLYSRNMLIAPYKGITGLMFRVANKKQFELIESEASVTMTIYNPETKRREFFNLKLEISKINFLTLSWTLVHPIDESSPIYGLSIEDMAERDVEVLILIKAISDTFSQTVYSRHSYKAEHMIARAKFRPLVPNPVRGKLVMSVTEIHEYDMVEN